jgi:hypothetical protein
LLSRRIRRLRSLGVSLKQQDIDALIKKENKIFLLYKEIQKGAVAKSYLRKGFLKYEENAQIFSHI